VPSPTVLSSGGAQAEKGRRKKKGVGSSLLADPMLVWQKNQGASLTRCNLQRVKEEEGKASGTEKTVVRRPKKSKVPTSISPVTE